MATTKTTTTYGNYKVDTFTGAGTISWTTPTDVTSIEVLVVGGGAGGKYPSAYFGNASTPYLGTKTPSGTYTITVGAGGAGLTNGNGGSSSIGSLATSSGGSGLSGSIYHNGLTETHWGIYLDDVGGGGFWTGSGENGVVQIKYTYNIISTSASSDVTSASFTANGTITAIVGTPTRRGFCYKVGTSGTPTTSDSVVYDDLTFSIGNYSKSITSLSGGTSYLVRAYDVVSSVTYYGSTIIVTTLSLSPDILDVDGIDLIDWTDNDTGLGFSSLPNNFETAPIWEDSSGAEIGMFSLAPGEQVVYCNGVDSVIWGGDEMRIGAFITSTAVIPASCIVTNPTILTEQMMNDKTDSDNVAYIGGGVDASVVLMLHGDGADASTTIIDSSVTTPKTVTAVDNAQLDITQIKFGVSSILFDGFADYLTVPDSTDWYFAAAPFTIDFWVRFNSVAIDKGFCGQWVTTFYIMWSFSWESGALKFYCKNTSVQAHYTVAWTPVINTWYHLELVRNGTAVYIFVNGISQTLTVTTAITTNEIPNLASLLYVGASGGVIANTYVMDGWLDEFRISKGVARHISNFTVMTVPYSPNANTFLVGTTRPLQGIKPYVLLGNTIASTITGSVWTGASWIALTLTDNTNATKSLAQTGTITFPSTVDVAVARYIEGYFLFWYQFTLSAGDATLYKVTVDAPMQPIMNIWDGVAREISTFFKTTNGNDRSDESINVYQYTYDGANPLSYCDISSLPANHYLEVAFVEKITALGLYTATGYHNVTTATVISISYWDGTQYSSVGTISDSTSIDGVSLAQNGFVSWNNANISGERKRSLEGGNLLYFYKISFSVALHSGVRLFYVSGIPASNTKSGYSFPLYAADRLMLGCDKYGKQNVLSISTTNSPDVFNGTDSYDILIGDDSPITCGTSIFAQYASNIYNMALIFKETETWSLVWTIGTTGTGWTRFKVSPNIGCPAPRTLKTVSASFEHNVNAVKVIAIWRAEDGIYVSNGQAPLKVSGDIDDLFDQTKPNHVCLAMVKYENAFMDNHLLEYHWQYATDLYEIDFINGLNNPTEGVEITGNTSGAIGIVDHVGTITGSWGTTAAGKIYIRITSGSFINREIVLQGSTTIAMTSSVPELTAAINNSLDQEVVLDLIEWKWFNIDRTSGKRLQFGIEAIDSDGNNYSYGFIDTGYMERLEYGNDFDGEAITGTWETGDQMHVENDLFMKTSLTRVNLIAIAKNTDSTVTFTHTMDSSTTSTDYTLSITSSNRYANVIKDVFSSPGIFHSYKFTSVTSKEVKGFEPLFVAAYYKKVRDHIN